MTRKGRKRAFFFNVVYFLKGVSAGMVRCYMQRQQGGKKVVTGSQRQRQGEGLGAASGAVSALSYYFHFPFPELSAALRS